MSDVFVVDYRQQTFNDALWSLEQARKLNRNTDPFEYWKYCSWSIISATICMESYITSHIREISTEIDPQIWSILQQNIRGFYDKIYYLEQITNASVKDDQDSDWRNISDIISLRNDIIHFNYVGIFHSITENNAENAIKACRDSVKKLHIAMGTNYLHFAPWIDNIKYEHY